MEPRHCHILLLPAGAGRRWRQPDEGPGSTQNIVSFSGMLPEIKASPFSATAPKDLRRRLQEQEPTL
ncbi:hypothetical protein M2360_003369 [Rhizobium sp. SG_E_25_P2]|nr:hypothetical protein [Rhizobium sp. SG_E_25_P2]